MNESTPTAPAPAATTPPVAPAEFSHGLDRLTPEEAAKMVEWQKIDVAMGRATPEQAAKAFDQLGATPEQRAPDTRSDEQKLVDEHFPVAKPHEFVLRWNAPGDDTPLSVEAKQFDQSARTWLSGAEFPAHLGNSLITNIEKVAQATKHMNADQLESYGYAEFAKLERAYGPALDDKLRAAGRMVEDLDKKTPGLKNLLNSKGLGDNAMIASLLIQQSERYWARRKGR